VKLEYTSKAGKIYLGLFRSGLEMMNGTRGKVKTHPKGKDEVAMDETMIHVMDKRLAVVRAANSFPFRNSSCKGKRIERDRVNNCKMAIIGQMRKTRGAGVTKVGNI
jgi:hypothetical protein